MLTKVDFAMDVFRQLYPNQEVPKTLRDKRSSVVTQLKQLQSETEPIIKIFEDQTVVEQIESTRDGRDLFQFLEKEHNFKLKMLDTLYAYAKFQYECGNYTGATEYLSFHRVLAFICLSGPPEDKRAISSLWGKLASEILMQNWDASLEDLQRLQEVIDSNLLECHSDSMPTHSTLSDYSSYHQQKLEDEETTSPEGPCQSHTTGNLHLQRSYYRVYRVFYVNFDFDNGQQKLRECETRAHKPKTTGERMQYVQQKTRKSAHKLILSGSDDIFFLVALLDDFIENARHLIFETFCRIHNCISIDMLAEKLNMASEQAERWIVNLIRDAPRDAPLDAKIDSKLGHVVMGIQNVSPYQQVIQKTKTLVFRSQNLAINIEKKEKALAVLAAGGEKRSWTTDYY
ncbi:putative eukaryotic translation initiation factor 3 subunit E-B isoform X2 [Apostichopus japonicus]|uniref:Eukaryotic translation initiation factor 3 subunit E n=1 Tax=Stichopus japonicus TaxID=307972 RepID=A0A2G8KJP1_STIJA|nr:putative eukaryotic translation initiation factor 3 subunit E-B isoform X2 [Apostichopus japonicus]